MKVIDSIKISGKNLDEAIIKFKQSIEKILLESMKEDSSRFSSKSISSMPTGIRLAKVLMWIKNNLGKTEVSIPPDLISFEEKFNGEVVFIERYSLKNSFIDFTSNPVFEVSHFGINTHLYYIIKIKNTHNNKVIQIIMSSYDSMLQIAKIIGYNVEILNTNLFKQFEEMVKKAGTNKNKLDTLYERIPEKFLRKLKSFDVIAYDFDILLDTNWTDWLGTSEEKAIFKALTTLVKIDEKKLYVLLFNAPQKVLQLYDKLSGVRNDFLKLINKLAFAHGKRSSEEYLKAFVSNKDSFILKDIFLSTVRNSETGLIDVYSSKGLNWTDFWKGLGGQYNPFKPNMDTTNPTSQLVTSPIINANPLELASLRTNGKKENEAIEKTETILTILHLAEKEKSKRFWELVSLTTSIMGTTAAIRVLTLGGASLTAKVIATIEIAKEATEIAMLIPKVRKILKDNDLGWLVDNWNKISIATDVTTLGIEGLINLIKNGSKGARVLKEAGHLEEAAFLRKKTKEARTKLDEIINVETKLARKLKKELDTFGYYEEVKEVEDFIRKRMDKEYGYFFDDEGYKLLDDYIVSSAKDGASVSIAEALRFAKKRNRQYGGAPNNLVFTHNHINGGALSPSDVLAAIDNNLLEVRAIGRNGIDYSLRRTKSSFPLVNSPKYDLMMKKVENIVQTKHPKFSSEIFFKLKKPPIDVAEFYAETLLKQFDDYIVYTKFTN